jgi:ubiquinone/menaquinone biosynthesis C-methylase UbiE
MQDDGLQTVGIDVSHRAAALARHHGQVVVADMQRLPFRSGSFDALVSFGSLEHAPDLDQALRECHRVLQGGGNGLFVVPNSFGVLRRLYRGTGQPVEHRDTLKGWSARFRKAGFSITTVQRDRGPGVFEAPSVASFIRRLLLWLVNHSGRYFWYQYILVVEKG